MSTCEICRPKKNAANSKYAHGSTGKDTRTNYWQSSQGKTVRKRFNSGEGGKAARKKWSESDKGQAFKTVFNGRQAQNYHEKPGLKLNLKLVASFRAIVKKKQKTCSLLNYTEFESIEDVLAHFESQLPQIGNGITMSDHGSAWWVGHRIPRVYFDHTNMEDVKKCWSKANMFPQPPNANRGDTCFLTVENCVAVGHDHFPQSWNGIVPNDDQLAIMYSKAHDGGV